MNKNEGIHSLKIEANNHYDFGFKLGHSLKEKINFRLAKNKIAYKIRGAKDYSKLVRFSKKFLPAIEKRCPQILDELKGIKDGSGASFDDLLALQCEEELLDFRIPHYYIKRGHHHCTNIAMKTYNNKMLVGHNEDWMPEYAKNGLVVLKGRLRGRSFISMSEIGGLVGTGPTLTSKKFAYIVNSLELKKFRYQVPRFFQLAELMEIKKPEEITKILDFSKSSIGSNTLIAWANSKILDIEELWRHYEKFKSNKWFIHTNHPLIKKYQSRKNTERESVRRYNKAYKILSNEKKLGLGTLKKILSDHETEICGHPGSKITWSVTIASTIINPTDLWMEVSSGNPCKNKYKRYYL